jgi:hypothetical protein
MRLVEEPMSSSDSSFSSSFFSSAGAASAAPPAAAPPEAAAAPPPPPPDGTEASLEEPSEISCAELAITLIASCKRGTSYLVNVLALELADELLEALVISLDTDGFEDLLDVAGGGRGVATEAEEQVCREVLHSDGWLGSLRNRSSIDLTCVCEYDRVAICRRVLPCGRRLKLQCSSWLSREEVRDRHFLKVGYASAAFPSAA